MTMRISKTKVLKALSEAVKKRGEDFVAEKCFYWDGENRRPGCIVGVAFRSLDIKPDVLKKMDRCDAATISSGEVAEILSRNGVSVDRDAMAILRRAQQVQDSKRSWGDALVEAKATAGLLSR